MIKRWSFALFIAATVSLCIKLGFWQIDRQHEKNKLLSQFELARQIPPLPIHKQPFDDLLFKRVYSEGHYLPAYNQYIVGRYRNGVMGYHLITPLRTQTDRIILVNRGWINEKPFNGMQTSPVHLSGSVMPLGKAPAFFLPQHNPERQEWINADVTAIAAHVSQQLQQPVDPILVQHWPGDNPSAQPISIEPHFHIRNDHMQYAYTWFGLAAAITMMYGIFIIKTRRNRL